MVFRKPEREEDLEVMRKIFEYLTFHYEVDSDIDGIENSVIGACREKGALSNENYGVIRSRIARWVRYELGADENTFVKKIHSKLEERAYELSEQFSENSDQDNWKTAVRNVGSHIYNKHYGNALEVQEQ